MTEPWSSTTSRIRTSNFDTALTGFRRLYGDAVMTLDDPFEWNADVASLGPLILVQGTLNTVASFDITAQRYTLLFARAKSLLYSAPNAHDKTVPGAKAAVFSPGTRTIVKADPVTRTSNFLLEPKFLEDQFLALTGEEARGGIHFSNALALHSPTGALIEQLCLYMAHESRYGSKGMHPALASSVCESLSRALILGHPHNHSFLVQQAAPPSSRTVVRLVEEYVDAHAGGPIVASDLAAVTGASVKSIEAAFQKHRQTSPLAFLKERRLEHARRLLLEDATVPLMQAAQKAGYFHVAPFEAAYFRRFGESPVETRHRGLLGHSSALPLSAVQTPAERLALLSQRERDVCARVVQGKPNKLVADELGITERTVKEHRGRAMKKLGLQSVAELVRLFGQEGK